MFAWGGVECSGMEWYDMEWNKSTIPLFGCSMIECNIDSILLLRNVRMINNKTGKLTEQLESEIY